MNICFGGTFLISLITTCLIQYSHADFLNVYYYMSIYIYTCTALSHFFVDHEIRSYLEMDNHGRIIGIAVLLLFGIGYWMLQEFLFHCRKCYMGPSQFSIFYFSMPWTINYFILLSGYMKSTYTDYEERNEEEDEEEEEEEEEESENEDSEDTTINPIFNFKELQCGVCIRKYRNEGRIPRILTDCGHTLCQKCAKKLWKQESKIAIICPFCRELNDCYAPVDKLMKNFTIIGLIQEIKETTKALNESNEIMIQSIGA
uniref:RING-type domain-containing protein n=1 Tax=Caenorhabditis tropicalis TaxID=1561998 RepID=A0A1I7TMG5_9PELO